MIPTNVLTPSRRPARALLALLMLLPLALCAALASYFYYQSRYDETLGRYPFAWDSRAQWLTTHAPDSRFGAFRKTVFVNGQVRSAYIAVVADNFSTLYINGQKNGTLAQVGNEASPYTGIGIPRHTVSGHLIDISHALRPGRNVIAILTDTDEEHAPRLAVQGSICTTERQQFYSDDTWRCAPGEQKQGDVSWVSPDYVDAGWQTAQPISGRVTALMDGTVGPIETPYQAAFIGASAWTGESNVTFRRNFECPGATKQGWLRIVSSMPYDLTLNGQLLASTSLSDGYGKKLVRGFLANEGLARSNAKPTTSTYPDAQVAEKADEFFFKDVFRRGTNTVVVTLHQQDLAELKRLPSLYLDSALDFEDGTRRTLHTDDSWQVRSGDGTWAMAHIESLPGPTHQIRVGAGQELNVTPTLGNYARLVRNGLVFFAAFCGLAWLCAWLAPGGFRGGSVAVARRMGTVFAAPAVVLAAAGMAQLVFVPSAQNVFFSSKPFALAVLGGAAFAWAAAAIASLLLARRVEQDPGTRMAVPAAPDAATPGGLRAWANRYAYAVLVAVLMVGSAMLSGHDLASDPYHPDEYVSMLAARGIMHTGIPLYQNSGILYPRSSLYHYLLAPLVALSYYEGNFWYTRILSVFWGVLLIPVAYLFGREAKGRIAGIGCAVAVGFSPYMVVFARETRFYEQFAFFTTLMAYLLLKSLRNPDVARYRVGTVLAFTAAYLSQQISLTLIPAIVLVVVLSGQGRKWLTRRSLAWLGGAAAVVIVDLGVYFKYCVTPLPFIDNSANPLLALHTNNLEDLPLQILTANEHTQLAIGMFYVGGLGYALIRQFLAPRTASPDDLREDGLPWWSYLYLLSGITMMLSTLFIPRATARYIIHLNPLFLITGVCVATHLGQFIYRWVRDTWHSGTAGRAVQWAYVALLAIVVVAGFRPARVWNTGDRQVHHDAGGAAQFVAAHEHPGDKVMVYSTEITMVELGKCDYFWRPSGESLDKYISRDGKLRERNSGAIVLDSVDKLKTVMAQHKRLWLVVSPAKVVLKGGGTAGPMNKMLTSNFDMVHATLNAQVWLWDRDKNHFYDTRGGGRGDEQFNL